MTPFLIPIAAKLLPVRKFFASIPRPVWIAIGIVAVIGLGWALHAHSVKKAYRTGYSAGVAAEGARIARKAEKLAAEAAAISAKAKELNSETNRRIAAGADALRVSWPGKAACLNPATPSAGRPVAPIGKPDAAGPQVPPADGQPLLTAVPWPWLVDRAEQCDLNRAEAETWRAWHKQLEESWQRGNR